MVLSGPVFSLLLAKEAAGASGSVGSLGSNSGWPLFFGLITPVAHENIVGGWLSDLPQRETTLGRLDHKNQIIGMFS